MHFTHVYAITALGLVAMANAEKGAAKIFGCVWHSAKPVKSYRVSWSPGGSGDRCMRLTGSAASMDVTDQGLTCIPLGKAAVDDSGLCYFRESWWGLSYLATGAPYSGSTNSQWTTGPSNSDITLHDQSPGTNVCPSKSHCTSTFLEWDNDSDAYLYFVFEPGKVGKFTSEEGEEDIEVDKLGMTPEDLMRQQVL